MKGSGSDHLPIVSSLNPSCFPEKFRPNYLDLTKNISWTRFSCFVSEGIFSMPSELNLMGKYELFIGCSKTVPARRDVISHRPDGECSLMVGTECMGLNDERLASFRNFRRNGSSENFGRYTDNEDRLLRLCESKQTASWRQYCSTLSSRSRMSDVWRMARRFRDPARGFNSFSNPEGWLSDFADRIAR
jgi:hypothetical protein